MSEAYDYHTLRQKSPLKIQHITSIEVKQRPGEHATLVLEGILEEKKAEKDILQRKSTDTIEIYVEADKKETLFKGFISSVATELKQGTYYVRLEGISGSILLDQEVKKRSFQDVNMTYEKLIKEVLKKYKKKDLIVTKGDKEKIEKPIFQYDETDWSFVKRLGSYLGTYVLADIEEAAPRLILGVPKGKNRTLSEDCKYIAKRDLAKYHVMKSQIEGAVENNFYYYHVETTKNYQIGDTLTFQNKKMMIRSKEIRMEKGQLIFTYELGYKKGYVTPYIANDALRKAVLEGKVLEVEGQTAKLHLDIDEKQDKKKAYSFPIRHLTSNAFYCMPEKDTMVHLTMNHQEEGEITSVIRTNGSECEQTSEPAITYFQTAEGKQIRSHEGGISLTAKEEEDKQIKLLLQDNGVLFKSEKTMQLLSKEGIEMSAPIVRFRGANLLKAEKSTTQKGFSIENEIHIMESNINVMGSPMSFSPMEQPKTSEAKPKKKWSWSKILTVAVAAVAIVGMVALTVATFGAAAVIASAATCAVIGAGVSVVGLAVSDVANKRQSSLSDYVWAAIKGGISGAITGAIFGPFAGVNTVGWKALAVGIGGEGALDSMIMQIMNKGYVDQNQLVQDVAFNFITFGLFSAGSRGLLKLRDLGGELVEKIDDVFRSSKKAKVDIDGSDVKAPKVHDGLEASSSKSKQPDDCHIEEVNKCKAGDPINMVTGAFTLIQQELHLDELGKPIEIKRNYDSTRKEVGVTGKGWYMNYETRIERYKKHLDLYWLDGHIETYTKDSNGQWVNQHPDNKKLKLVEDPQNNMFLVTTTEHETYFYDKDGKLVMIEDKNHNQTQLHYQGVRLTKIITIGKREIEFSYANNKLISIQDNFGRRTQYTYEDDLLIAVTYPNQGTTEYTYTEDGYIQSVRDRNGMKYLKNDYDYKGRVIKQQMVSGYVGLFSYYPEEGKTVLEEPKKGSTKTYYYNEDKLVTKISHHDGSTETFAYDHNQNKTIIKDRKGHKTYNTYNSYGLIVEKGRPEGLVTSYHYDTHCNLIKKVDNEGRENYYTYDTNHNLVEQRTKVTQGKYKVVKYAYDTQGRMVSKIDPIGNAITYYYDKQCMNKPAYYIDREGHTFHYTYDTIGRNLSITSSYGTVKFAYDAFNNKTEIEDARGNKTRIEHDRLGNRTRVVKPNQYHKNTYGQGYDYTYDYSDRLIMMTDPIGNKKVVKRDEEGNILKEIDPRTYDPIANDGEGISYVYDADGRRVSTVYPDGGMELLSYDYNGNVTKRIKPNAYQLDQEEGKGYRYAYDKENRLIALKNPDGLILKCYCYDKKGNLLEEINAEGYTTYYTYNLADELIEKRIPVNHRKTKTLYNVTLYTYDKSGNLIEEKTSRQYVTKLSYPKRYQSIYYKYDKNNRWIEIQDQAGAVVTYKYDCLGNIVLEKRKINDETNQIISYTYNNIGKLIEKNQQLKANDMDRDSQTNYQYAKTTYTYDNNGNLLTINTPEGYMTKNTYNPIDQLIKKEEIDKINHIHRITSYEYDAVGNLIKTTDTNGNTVTNTYDLKNRMTKVINEEGAVTRYDYDLEDNLIKRITANNYISESDDGVARYYTYNSYGMPLKITNELDEVIEENTYDIYGRLISTRDGMNTNKKYNYTIGHKIESITIPSIEKEEQGSTYKYQYDSLGNMIGTTNPNGYKTTYQLDQWGKITQINKADGSKEKYTYDCAGNVASTTDGIGNTTHYTYNSHNRVAYIADPENQKEYYYYDREGRIREHHNKNNIITQYMLNLDGHITMKRNKNTLSANKYHYNRDGTLGQARGSGITYTYQYTQGNRLKRKLSKNKTLVDYDYDLEGNVITIGDIAGHKIHYKYDAVGRKAKVSVQDKELASYGYNSDNTVKSIEFDNGIKKYYTYDEQKNITALELINDKEEFLSCNQYSYDANQNLIWQKNNQDHITYTYDALDRLVHVNYDDRETKSYTYDKAGNRSSEETRADIKRYSYDIRNRLTRAIIEKTNVDREAVHKVETKYQYDNQGNLLNEYTPEGVIAYTYDGFNRTTSVTNHDGTYSQYLYDTEELRVAKTVNGKKTRYIYAQGESRNHLDLGIIPNNITNRIQFASENNIISQTDEDDNILTGYFRGNELIGSYVSDMDDHSVYITNEQGDISYIMDQEQHILNAYTYDPYGNMLTCEEEIPNIFGYRGQQLDRETHHYYLRARYYDPEIGRFTQEDVNRNDGLNLYTYCRNNPIKYWDPSGYQCPDDEPFSSNVESVQESPQVLNHRGEPVTIPDGHIMSPRDPAFSEPPIIMEGPFTTEQRNAFRNGNSGGTRIGPHHRHQIPTTHGGVIDELPGPGHPLGNVHTAGTPTRHPSPSIFNSMEGGNSLRQAEIRAHWQAKGERLVEVRPGEWIDPGI